jgi:glutamine---fructose-6-phosphate transaminase (isomerizing)
MCGIYGYIGDENPIEKCLDGLAILESRGYDSTGIAGVTAGRIAAYKEAGNLSFLKEKLANVSVQLETAIAHTRWATHGKVTVENAHPHLDKANSLALVHNGIIENFAQIKEEIQAEGIEFQSETDTEAIVQLIAKAYKGDLLRAVGDSVKKLKGSFAFAVIHKDHPDQIIAAARECPLSIAYDDKQSECIISSDPQAFTGSTLNVLFLQKDEIARVRKGSIELFTSSLNSLTKKIERLEARFKAPSKEGFEHYLLKEIHEQPQTIRNTLNNTSFDHLPIDFKGVKRIWILGCGTAANAGSLGAHYFEELAQIPTQCDIASEARYRIPIQSPDTLVLAISQSGETADTISAVREVRAHGFNVVTICNVRNSTLTRVSDGNVYLHAGPEISVCSTKAFSSMVSALLLFALHIAKAKGLYTPKHEAIEKELMTLPAQIEQVLLTSHAIEALGKKYSHYEDFFFLGRSLMFPTSLEASLKLKEISYVNANAYPGGELKHGPIALLNSKFPVVAFCANRRTQEKMISNLMEVKARSAPLLVIAPAHLKEVEPIADDIIWLPSSLDEIFPFASSVAGQLLAYFIAKERGCEIDQPRNLAKSVTVE